MFKGCALILTQAHVSSSLNYLTKGYTKNKALVPTLKARKIPLYLPFIGKYRSALKGSAVILGRAHMFWASLRRGIRKQYIALGSNCSRFQLLSVAIAPKMTLVWSGQLALQGVNCFLTQGPLGQLLPSAL